MKIASNRFLPALTLTLFSAACGSSDPASGGTGGMKGGSSGGSTVSTGGSSSTGGSQGSGGASSSGGATTLGTGGASIATGGAGTGGANGTGGRGTGGVTPSGTGGAGSGGRGGTASTGGVSGTGGSASGGAGGSGTPFSFFVTSLAAMKRLSGNAMGFGGDLRHGEATGLAGADKICREIAETAMPGAGSKTWHAFLSTVAGPVHAIDRVGEGPWYDRMGRLVALNKADLMQPRPRGANAAIINDLPNENGIPNHTDGQPGCTGNSCPDNHDTLTGTNAQGRLYSTNLSNTCNDWTSAAATNPGGRGLGPWCGHSWPRTGSGVNWMSALAEGGCGPGVNLVESGGPENGVYTVGTGGGYGGIYCFALTP